MRFLAILCSIFLALGVTIVYASAIATPRHACAPAVPPLVPNATLPAQTPGIVVINEVLRTPGAKSVWECMSTVTTFSTNLWIELYNPQNQPFDLYAVRSSLDSGPQTQAFLLPFGAAIAPHGFLVIFPNTFLGAPMEVMTLRLLMYNTIIDQVSVPALATDTAYARIPDGSPTWSTTAYPTIDASNALAPVLLPTPTHTVRSTSGTVSHKNVAGHTSTPGTVSTGTIAGSAQQHTPTISGTEPTWSAEHFSDQTNIADTVPLSTPSSPSVLASTQPINTGMDLTTKIWLTLATLMLVITAVWIWRLFFKT